MIHFSVHAQCDTCKMRFRFKGDTLEICWGKFWTTGWNKSADIITCPKCLKRRFGSTFKQSTGGS